MRDDIAKLSFSIEHARSRRDNSVQITGSLTHVYRKLTSEGDLDVRHDLAIGEQILAFLKPYAPRSTVVTDRIIGCPHEEGTDYPEGASCPQSPIGPGVTDSNDRIQ
jgi:hypothetical protein